MVRARSILIVDDDDEICDFLTFEFARRGWQAAFALDGDAAWACLTKQRFDVVVSDVRMPVSDGLSLLRRVRTLDVRPAFILMSGYTDIERMDPQSLDADAIVAKPFDVEELVQRVDLSLAKRLDAGAVR